MRKYAGDKIEIFGSGIDPKIINPYVYKVIEEVGLNLDCGWSKNVKDYFEKS